MNCRASISSVKLTSRYSLSMLRIVFIIVFLQCSYPSTYAALQGSPNVLEHFPSDFYKVEGAPDVVVSMQRSNVYQGEDTSFFISLMNWGKVTSIEVNEDPAANAPEELFAAEKELELERARTTAQDISVNLKVSYPSSQAPLEVKREVAYAGSLLEGQISPTLEFPVEIYENTPPGNYTLYAVVNYTYQWDVAVEPESIRPKNPDIFYLYNSKSQVVPLKVKVERRSGVEFDVLEVLPASVKVNSKDNVVKIIIENVGDDEARDLVVRLKPESGIYISVDESPIPLLKPGERAELIYKLDVSKEAVSGKMYMLTLLFEFSDSYRDDLTDTEHAYITMETDRYGPFLNMVILVMLIALVSIIIYKRRNRR